MGVRGRSGPVLAICAALAFAPAASAASRHSRHATPAAVPNVVQDTDMDFDDAAALSYLAAQDIAGRIHLRAVTVENDGVGMPGFAIAHARCLLERYGLGNVPVAEGPAVGQHPVPLVMRAGVEAMLVQMLGPCAGAGMGPGQVTAAALLRRTFARYPRAELVASGPLTNVAAAWPLRVSHIVSMAGAVHVPAGVCCEDSLLYDGSQELNVFADPAAAQKVIAGAAPGTLTLVAVDATNHVPLTKEFTARLKADDHTPEAATVLSIASNPVLANAGSLMGGVFWWDPLAAVSLLHPSLLSTETDPLSVVQSGRATGQTAITATGTPTRVAISADQAAFEQDFIDGLNER